MSASNMLPPQPGTMRIPSYWMAPSKTETPRYVRVKPTGCVSVQLQSHVAGNVRQAPKYSFAGIFPVAIPM